MRVNIPTLLSVDFKSFNSHRTTFFSFVEKQSIYIEDIIKNRIGPAVPLPIRGSDRHIAPYAGATTNGSPDPVYNRADRAELVVTDEPSDIFNYIDPNFIQRKFKLTDVEKIADNMGLHVKNWSELESLPITNKSAIYMSLIVSFCQRERKSEESVLGYKRMSWEQFSKQYKVIINESNEQVYAFPNRQVDSYGLYMDRYNSAPHTDYFISFGQHDPNSEEEMVWIQSSGKLNIWEDGKINVKLIKATEISDICRRLEETTAGAQLSIIEASPVLDLYDAPSLLRSIKYVHYFQDKSFALPALQSYARALGVKGFSTKTKAELSILIGEAVEKLDAHNSEPGLILSYNPNDIEEMGYDHTLVQPGKNYGVSDYYRFTSRVISSAVYAPTAPASPAGRIPTDGNFQTIKSVKPLNLFEGE